MCNAPRPHKKPTTDKEHINCQQNKIIVCTFATSKGYIKILLLILISCCYINTVFEFSDTKKKANFENEIHAYVQQCINLIFENSITQSIPNSDINCDTAIQFHLSAILHATKYN
jgi:hypothetical protein